MTPLRCIVLTGRGDDELACCATACRWMRIATTQIGGAQIDGAIVVEESSMATMSAALARELQSAGAKAGTEPTLIARSPEPVCRGVLELPGKRDRI